MVHYRQICEIYPKPLILLDTVFEAMTEEIRKSVVVRMGQRAS